MIRRITIGFTFLAIAETRQRVTLCIVSRVRMKFHFAWMVGMRGVVRLSDAVAVRHLRGVLFFNDVLYGVRMRFDGRR